MKKIIFIILGLVIMTCLSPSLSLVSCSSSGGAGNYALQGANELGSNCTGKGIIGGSGSVIDVVVNILTAIGGIIVVVLIIFSGFRYITSGGDSNRTGAAKKTLIGALIGLVFIVLAQLIVHFVINVAGK